MFRLERKKKNVSFKQVCFFQGYFCMWISLWWLPSVFCYHLLSVQFITPVHYSICWALSTWIIESYASIINYSVHVHNSHFRVYSFTVKIHCVGTSHTRSYIEKKLIYKYIFFFPKLNIHQILHFFFLVMTFRTFTAAERPMKKNVLHVQYSFFFVTNIYGVTIPLTVEGWGRSICSLCEDWGALQPSKLWPPPPSDILKPKGTKTPTNQILSSPASVVSALQYFPVHLEPWALKDPAASWRQVA